MGQIANDFKEWVLDNKSEYLRPGGGEPYLPFNVSQMSELFEEFLIWKARQIRNTEDEQLNSHHGYPPTDVVYGPGVNNPPTRMSKEQEMELIRQIIRNTKSF